MSRIYNIYGEDAHEMTKALLDASGAISLVPPRGSVALKPNLVVADTPDNGATTHAGVLSGAIEYFRDHGVQDISIIEGSWVGDETMRAMRRAGYDRVCERYKVQFHDLKRDRTRYVQTQVGAISVCCRALDAGLLVNLPVLKGHCQTVMTCALKNLKGCLPDREKRRFHSMGLTKPIAALGAALRPGLTIVDSICGDLRFEEGGNPVRTNRMYLGTDPVQLDAWGCGLMGLELRQVPYIELAEEYGAGRAEVAPEDIVNLNAPAEAEGYSASFCSSGTIIGLLKNVHEKSACSACYASLVRALYASRPKKKNEKNSANENIYIGQGWRGKSTGRDLPFSSGGLGIGDCCSGAERYVPGCPPSAADIAEFL